MLYKIYVYLLIHIFKLNVYIIKKYTFISTYLAKDAIEYRKTSDAIEYRKTSDSIKILLWLSSSLEHLFTIKLFQSSHFQVSIFINKLIS